MEELLGPSEVRDRLLKSGGGHTVRSIMADSNGINKLRELEGRSQRIIKLTDAKNQNLPKESEKEEESKKIKKSKEILNYLNGIYKKNGEYSTDTENYISVYAIKLLCTEVNSLITTGKNIEIDINEKLRPFLGSDSKQEGINNFSCGYNLDTGEFNVSLYSCGGYDTWGYVTLKKENDRLVDVSNENRYDKVLSLIDSELRQLCDIKVLAVKLESQNTQIESLDSEFIISIEKGRVELKSKHFFDSIYLPTYFLDGAYGVVGYEDGVAYNSTGLSQEGFENLLKNIYVNVSDCPQWLQDTRNKSQEKKL